MSVFVIVICSVLFCCVAAVDVDVEVHRLSIQLAVLERELDAVVVGPLSLNDRIVNPLLGQHKRAEEEWEQKFPLDVVPMGSSALVGTARTDRMTLGGDMAFRAFGSAATDGEIVLATVFTFFGGALLVVLLALVLRHQSEGKVLSNKAKWLLVALSALVLAATVAVCCVCLFQLPGSSAAISTVRGGNVKIVERTCPEHFEPFLMGNVSVCFEKATSHAASVAGSVASAYQSVVENIIATPSQCVGDGASGKRVQAVYVRKDNEPDLFDVNFAKIRQIISGMDKIMALSSSSQVALRWVHDAQCWPTIARITLPASVRTFADVVARVREMGFADKNRKYAIFFPSRNNDIPTGVGTLYVDDKPGADNANNAEAGYSVCSGTFTAYCMMHEIAHNLGAVQYTAPHTSKRGHCFEERDLMCYLDDGNVALAINPQCSDANYEFLLDCGNDDYFNPAPAAAIAPTNYLANHWNIARSDFMFRTTTFDNVASSVIRLYAANFLRQPDLGGISFWVNKVATGLSLVAVADAFAASPEFLSMYGQLSSEAFVDLVYRNVLNRQPDEGGRAYWAGRLKFGGLGRGAMMIGFSDSEEYKMIGKVQGIPIQTVTSTWLQELRK